MAPHVQATHPVAAATKKTDTRHLSLIGFRTLSVLATFLAGLQAQLLTLTAADNSTLAIRFVNACWMSALVLEVFGAITASLTARWLELLDDSACAHLSANWNQPANPHKDNKSYRLVDRLIATALFSPLGVIGLGVGVLLVGLLIYVWAKQPLLVSITSTISFSSLTALTMSYFIPHASRKKDVIELLGRKGGAW